MKATFASIRTAWPDSEIRAAVWNAGAGIFKTFLNVTENDIKQSLDTNVIGAFAFARETILAFKEVECVLDFSPDIDLSTDCGRKGQMSSESVALLFSLGPRQQFAGTYGLQHSRQVNTGCALSVRA